MLGEFSREHETHGGLNFTARERGLFVVGGELSSLRGDALENVVDKRVHDRHALFRDSGVGVDCTWMEMIMMRTNVS